MFNYILLSIILAIAFFELIAQSSVKYFHKTEKTQYIYYFIAILSYCVVAYLLTLSYDHKGMGITNLLWSGITIVVILTAGMILYGEKLTNYDVIGLCLILSGTGFILYEENFD
jgi:multidrug transporter EmrE-like cation transporter